MVGNATLELVQLTKSYSGTVAVNAIDLKIPEGRYCCLLGPSGCGKTSTLRMIAGHEAATSGDILIGNPKADFIDLSFPQGPNAPGSDPASGRLSDTGDAYIVYGNNFGSNRSTP